MQGPTQEDPHQLRQILCHQITLTRPDKNGTGPYDEFAEKLINAILARLSVLPNTDKDCMQAFVSDLTPRGEIVISVLGVSVQSDCVKPADTRQAFLLAIHNTYHSLLMEQADAAAAQVSQNVKVSL